MPRHRSDRHGHRRNYVLPRRSSHEQDAQTPADDSPRGRPAQTHQHGRPHSPQGRRQDKVARRAIDVGGDAGGYAAFRNPSLGQPVDMVARHTKSIAADAANPTNNLAAPTPMSSMTTSNAPNHAPRPIFVPKVDMIYGDDLARARRNLQLEKNFQSSAGRTRPKLRVPDAMFRQGPSTKPQRPADEPAAQSEGQIVDMGWKEMLGMLEQKVGALEAENRKLQHENDQFRAWLNQAPK